MLDAVLRVRADRRGLAKACKGATSHIWSSLCNEVAALDKKKYPHSLPTNERRFREKVVEYEKKGYTCLLNGSLGNSFARKVDEKVERLILSIYCMSNKPYSSWVQEDYMAFVSGRLDIVDMATGELMDRDDYYDEAKGCYITISESTCWNYINNPKNRAVVDSVRTERHKFGGTIRPHVHRHAAMYALSKISLDDRDLPRKMLNGKRLMAYYAYDVASGCLIGAAYSEGKNRELFIDCIRDMFRFVDARGWGMPMEMEVEHHLANLFEDDLLKAGTVFPFVRWCAPGNSQEKHAEQFNKQKKYGYEKRYQDGVGRFYSKLEANQTGGQRYYNDETQQYEIKERRYTVEQLIADDQLSIERYNNGLHRDQKRCKGMTRMEVMMNNINPQLVPINRALLVRYIGNCTTTTIQRNQYVQVQYNDYTLPSPQVLAKLAPNNYTVQAYYMPGDEIGEVYIYQNANYLAKCEKLRTFTTAAAEWTKVDDVAMGKQMSYINEFDKMVKEGKERLISAKLMDGLKTYEDVEVKVVEEEATAAIDEEYLLLGTDIDYTKLGREAF